MHPRAMSDATTRAQRYLACVSDPSRFRLVMELLRGECCVTDLARAIGLSQSCTTRHVQALRREGIVESDRAGKRVMIRLALDGGELNPALRWALASGAVEGVGVAPPRSGKVGRVRPASPSPGGTGLQRVKRRGGQRLAPAPAQSASTFPTAHELGWQGDEAGAVRPEPVAEAAVQEIEAEVDAPESRPAPSPRVGDLDDFLL